MLVKCIKKVQFEHRGQFCNANLIFYSFDRTSYLFQTQGKHQSAPSPSAGASHWYQRRLASLFFGDRVYFPLQEHRIYSKSKTF